MALTRARAYQILDSDIKQSVRAATTTSVTLAGGAPNTLDSVSLAAGDRILVKDQSPGSGNGIYVVTTLGTGSNGTWSRASDFDTTAKVTSGLQIYVEEGTTNGDKVFGLTTNNPITLGTTALTFSVLSSAGTSAAGGADTNIQYNSSGTFAGSANLTFDGSNVSISGYVNAGNLRIGSSGNTIQSNNTNGNIYLTPNGTGLILANASITAPTFTSNVGTGTAPFTVTSTTQVANLNVATAGTAGTVTTAAQPNITSIGNLTIANIANIQINNNSVISTNTNGNINLTPNGTGEVIAASLTVSDLTSGRLALVGSGGALTDTSALTWSGSSLTVTGNVSGGNINTSGAVVASTLTSNVADGTAPFTVTSTTQVANLNVATASTSSIAYSLNGGTAGALVYQSGSSATGYITIAAANTILVSNGSVPVWTLPSSVAVGTVLTAAQPNITSVGTLTSLGVSGAVTASTLISNVATGTAPFTVTSTTQVANLNVATAGSATTAGTVTTAAQPNITSLGTLTSLSVTQPVITAATPVGNINTTWNNASVTFTGLLMNVTDTASGAGSLLTDFQVGGASKFKVDKAGAATFATSVTAGTNLVATGIVQAGATYNMQWNGRGILSSPAAGNIQLGATDAASPVSQTLSAQSVVAGTVDTAGANLIIVGSKSTGTGAGGSIIFQVTQAGSTGSTQNAVSNILTLSSGMQSTFTGGVTASGNMFAGATQQLGWNGRTGLTSPGAQVLQIGAIDNTTPTAQTLQVQSAAGIADTSGQNFTIKASRGTGTGAGGALVFQVAPAGTTGTTQNALANALVIDSTKAAAFQGTVTAVTNITTPQFISNVATGTAPLVVTSTTQVANLNVATAGTAGTVTTAAQPNITSVGTLTSLGVSGAVTASTLVSNVATGTAPLTVTSTTQVANLNVATAGSATTAGTVTTAAQPNITSVGTLTNLNSSGNIIAGGRLASTASGGDEGGEITLALASANTTLSANVTIDIYQNKLRFFEGGGTNRGAFIDLGGAGAGVSTNILSGSVPTAIVNGTSNVSVGNNSNVTVGVAGTANVATFTSTGANVAGYITASGTITGDIIAATNNGNGTNFKVGDDAWIGDMNVSNTIRIKGQQNTANGYIVFGDGDNSSLGRSGTGPLTYSYNFAANGTITGTQLISNIATGTAPLVVTSTTQVANLNVANAGYADSATTAGTVTTAAQPNITSVGTLTSLGVNGTITGTRLISNIATGTAPFTVTSTTQVANLNVATAGSATTAGTVTTAAQPNITSVGTLTTLSVVNLQLTGNQISTTNTNGDLYLSPNGTGQIFASGVITSPRFISNVATGTAPFTVTSTTQVANLNVATAGTAGTVTTAAQPNITSVGTLTSLGVSGAVTASTLVSNVAVGTAPFTVTSTTRVANLNVATAGTADSATTAGTVTTAAQPNITSVGTLTSLSTSGDITVGGNLTVNGTTTTINATELKVNDLNITVANNAATAAAADGAGITVGGANASLTYVNASNSWQFDRKVGANGTITATQLISNVATGTAPLVVTSTTQVANLNVATAGTAGTVTTAAQPNITSVGTLTSLGVSGAVTASTLVSNVITGTAPFTVTSTTRVANLNVATAGTADSATTAGTVTTAAQPNITSHGTLTALDVNAQANATVFKSNVATGTAPLIVTSTTQVANLNVATAGSATTAGTVTTAAQPNITSVGTLTSLGVSGAVTASTLISNVATGTAPFTVTSTTQVANLNVATAGSATTAGTVTTAAQPNITSVGTLTSLTVSGTTNLGAVGNITITGGSAGNVLTTYGNGVVYWGAGGSGGASITVSSTAPTSPTSGALWWNQDDGTLYIYYADGTSNQWVAASPSAVGANNVDMGTTPPSSPVNGDLWFDTTSGDLYVYYADGTSNQWIPAASPYNLDPMTLDSVNSRVGINVTTPTQALDVSGNVNVTGNLVVTSNANLSNIGISGTTITGVTANANISIVPNGTGDIVLSADMVYVGDAAVAAVLTTNGAANLTINTNAGTNSGSIAITQGVNGNITLAPNGTGVIVSTASVVPSVDLADDLGTATLRWNNMYGTAVNALYADLAERYEADYPYEFGTVVAFGGTKEITATTSEYDTRIAGVISEDPAFLMNNRDTTTENMLPVALTGKVRCWTVGPVRKGDVLVSSNDDGTAQRIDNAKFVPGCIIGKSLENDDRVEKRLIWVVVGRF